MNFKLIISCLDDDYWSAMLMMVWMSRRQHGHYKNTFTPIHIYTHTHFRESLTAELKETKLWSPGLTLGKLPMIVIDDCWYQSTASQHWPERKPTLHIVFLWTILKKYNLSELLRILWFTLRSLRQLSVLIIHLLWLTRATHMSGGC